MPDRRRRSDSWHDGRVNRPGEDPAERRSKRSPGLAAAGRAPPGDEPVRADDDRAVAGNLAMPQPSAARVIQVPVEVPDPHRVERDIRGCRQVPGRFAPRLAD
jgi:hypothetical protein